MERRLDKGIIPLGPVLFALALALYKGTMLTTGIGAGWRELLVLTGLDLFFVAILLAIAILHAGVRVSQITAVPRLILRLVLVTMSALYLIDSFVLLALDDHAALFDIGRYSMEPGILLSFFDAQVFGAILLLLISALFVRDFTPVIKSLSLTALAVMMLVGILSAVYAPQPLARYAMLNVAGLIEEFGHQQPVSIYSENQMEFYSGLARESAEIPASVPDIILLVVESLSSINSQKVSASGDLLHQFDQLADEGLLFTNFFANHQASEGGMIALLSGFPPMHFPTASPYMFDEFALQPAVIAEYQKSGYFTEFLTNSDLSFIGLDRYLARIGIDRRRGRDEVESMRTAPRIVQAAPADSFLYTEALATIAELSDQHRPFLLTLATSSTHLPYTHAGDGPDTAMAVWDWSLRQLVGFYRQLKQKGYFEHGILIITGDHRQMRPLTRAETGRYGDSARARVPLLLIGRDYPPGTVDERFFQQSDLLRYLARVKTQASPLSTHPVWVERYNRMYGRVDNIDKLSVFDESSQGRQAYPLKVLGNRIKWLDERPGFARDVETLIHSQRSLHQKVRNGPMNGCRPRWAKYTWTPTGKHGLAVGIFDQAGINDVMDIRSLSGDRNALVELVDMPDMTELTPDSTVLFSGFIDIRESGTYRFRAPPGWTACLSIDKKLFLDQNGGAAEASEIGVELSVGLHFVDLRYAGGRSETEPSLEWITPGTRAWRWRPVPADRFYLGM